jgi:hypothetical protein
MQELRRHEIVLAHSARIEAFDGDALMAFGFSPKTEVNLTKSASSELIDDFDRPVVEQLSWTEKTHENPFSDGVRLLDFRLRLRNYEAEILT